MQHKILINLVTGLLAFSLFVFGLSMMLGGNDRYVHTILQFYALDTAISQMLAAQLLGGVIVIISALLVYQQPTSKKAALIGVSTFATLFLITLLGEARWINSLGGFPVIGSGQGIIKYFALLPIVMYLFLRDKFTAYQHQWLNFFPVALVLIWIGSMKFFEFEAKGIEMLLIHSPLMSWMYDLLSLQMASNLIGIYDLFFAGLLAFAIAHQSLLLLRAAVFGCGAVFIVTQTFLFTTPDALSATTLLTGTGQFIIKDIWFICNLLIITWLMHNQQSNPNQPHSSVPAAV
ncbi:DUF417 family protein [Pseudoalteromonas luteoviolacea]|uniref:DUF417 family protein n=1 Tax=Pseudoalteromonas luteoviolacea S4054 TaxID=1129367 RepID=A0A0F6AIB8_9GAMM|nr:DUF417 family protein [Pseudoalteromonas luteoviolacea]AOT06416.1 hypothetical protein S4054249_00255 [Pseudoalteromonas luteoviolacea]AOT11333.1 hypothetical protein S40542_00255 [Pseudoalteromonas luteoviolacea]AOT16246.1 hypothetical protein S4054_00255 [Pseudoalteromonas luteoviolacea]KKE85581.1 hypothetical protein N479_04585 [Pseudoalteromonas luteoviolacea S4054]KZN73013.1 hypothetical protein N481_13245 [Pseudoalteromonas luteoviolacea S4047-1]